MSTTITPPPSPPAPPQRAAGETSFWQKCDAFVQYIADFSTYLGTFVTQLAAVISEILGLRDDAAASAVTAQAQANEATAQAGNALEYALAAQAAQVTTPAWNPATAYSFPQIAVGSNGHTYRCTGQNVVGADPVTSGAVWTNITVGVGKSKLFFMTQG